MKTRSSLLLLMLGLGLGVALTVSWDWLPGLAAQESPKAARPQATRNSTADAYRQFTMAFREAAAIVQPCVVRIEVRQERRQPKASEKSPRLPDGLRRFFEFGAPDEWRRYFKRMPPVPREGLGTGVIVDPRGYIMTNNHVLEGFKEGEVHVTLYKAKSSLAAKVVGTDPKSDLAVIKVDAGKPLRAIVFGDSDATQVGDWVLAVGHPFEYSNSVSHGIVSAKGRTNALRGLRRTDFAVQNFIQTDAAINPGNSGGPLVNLDGELVGVNTFIASRSGAFNGLGFAVPSHIAKKVSDALIREGRVARGYLGVAITEIIDPVARQFGEKDAKSMAKALGLKSPNGAFVVNVMPDTPAAKAGLEAKDVIVEFDGRPIESRDDLTSVVRDTDVGKKVRIKVYRDGKIKELQTTLAEQPDEVAETAVAKGHHDAEGRSDVLGMAVQTLTPELAKRLELKDVKGVLVTEVDPDSPAAAKGIEPNDVILSVGLTPVETLKEFVAKIKDAEEAGRGIAVHVRGKGMIILR